MTYVFAKRGLPGMARKPRLEFPGALCHVIVRGNQRANILMMTLSTPLIWNASNAIALGTSLPSTAMS
ncbi:MAG: hypothetical protein ACT4PN_01595 [Nitrospiraceae bacterium]